MLFLLDAETAHNVLFLVVERLQKHQWFLSWVKTYGRNQPQSATVVAGMRLRNVLGIAAGFDKNARLLPFWEALGVGFVEVGTVTPLPQIGNPRPRMFRLPKDKAIINRMGFNNDGVDVLRRNLLLFRTQRPDTCLIIGGSIGKNKETSNEVAFKDYVTCYRSLHDLVDYFVVNVSSPNTPGLRDLQDGDFLEHLFFRFDRIRQTEGWQKKPIFIKISPDTTLEYLESLIQWMNGTKNCDGLILTNTTLSRDGLSYSQEHIQSLGNGGLSGPLLFSPMTDRIGFARERTEKVLMAVGGVNSPERFQDALNLGADAVQVYTGLVYEGPNLIKNILKTQIGVHK